MAGAKISLVDRVKLWPHQKAAFETAQRYLRRSSSRSADGSSALINIPTGGGKTAIIALLAHEGHKVRRALVLAPRVGIRDQLCLELSAMRDGGFFDKQGVTPRDLRRQVHKIESGSDLGTAPKGDVILVSTIQLIDRYRQHQRDSFIEFADSVDAVLVDEGHYEPAPSWSVTVRGFEKPSVLFTATPYRNDLRAFAMDSAAIHVTRFVDAVRERFVRDIDVVPMRSENTPAAFVEGVLREFKRYFKSAPNSKCKLIVRCERKDDVAKIGNEFERKGFTLIALHERFTRKDTAEAPWKLRVPGDPEKVDAPAIWIHQHKLLEGVDGPSFRAVAFYGPLGSVRALVQQIGRIIRNPGRKANQKALVFDHRRGRVARNWDRFKKYDAALTGKDLSLGAPEIVRASLEALPELDYIAENFRERFDLGMAFDVESEIAVPTSAYFLRPATDFDFDQFLQAVADNLVERSLERHRYKIDDDRYLFLYITWRNSPLLRVHYFVELELHAIVIRRFSARIAYFDTAGGVPLWSNEHGTSGPVARDRFSRLMSRTHATRITAVSTRNAALGPRAIRMRNTTAASIESTAPFLDDFQHVTTSLTGVSAERWIPTDPSEEFGHEAGGRRRRRETARRYMGLGRGHISEMGSRVSLGEYFGWLDAVDERLSSRREATALLGRYAQPLAAAPTAPDARNILLDLEEAREAYETLEGEGLRAGQKLELEDICADCERAKPGQPRSFEVRGHGRAFKGTVAFDSSVQRYVIDSPELAESFHYVGQRPGSDLVSFLNRSQSFSILPESPKVIYADGSFFSPNIGTGSEFDEQRFQVGKVLEVHSRLDALSSEKGNHTTLLAAADGWHANTVFGWFDQNLDRILDDPTLVVCDDMGKESADFIALDRNENRIVMIHCKARDKRSGCSASALQEICGQAVKNCGTLNLFNPVRPPNTPKWHQKWSSDKVTGSVNSRIRKGGGRSRKSDDLGQRLWQRLENRIRDPNAEREVWLVLGSTLSKNVLEKALRSDDPLPEAIQATHLLQSTLASIGGSNARLKILCSP
jgi:superfamily II DNA or RNA helicase